MKKFLLVLSLFSSLSSHASQIGYGSSMVGQNFKTPNNIFVTLTSDSARLIYEHLKNKENSNGQGHDFKYSDVLFCESKLQGRDELHMCYLNLNKNGKLESIKIRDMSFSTRPEFGDSSAKTYSKDSHIEIEITNTIVSGNSKGSSPATFIYNSLAVTSQLIKTNIANLEVHHKKGQNISCSKEISKGVTSYSCILKLNANGQAISLL